MKKDIETFIKNQKKKNQHASQDVLQFIGEFSCRGQAFETKAIKDLFSSGYCYYFAVILKEAFGGEIMWSKGYSHIVWRDTRCGEGVNISYDINGIYCKNKDLWPVNKLMADLESFKHRGHDNDITESIETYCKQHNINEQELNKLVFEIIPENDRVYSYPNIGDTCRFWDLFYRKADTVKR